MPSASEKTRTHPPENKRKEKKRKHGTGWREHCQYSERRTLVSPVVGSCHVWPCRAVQRSTRRQARVPCDAKTHIHRFLFSFLGRTASFFLTCHFLRRNPSILSPRACVPALCPTLEAWPPPAGQMVCTARPTGSNSMQTAHAKRPPRHDKPRTR